MRPIPFFLAVLAGSALAAAPVRAEDPPARDEAKTAAPARLAGERVRVRLKTGGTTEGVVLVKDTWERRDREHGWVAAKRDEAGAGVRLWYVGDLQGFQWVAAEDIAEMKSFGELTDDDRRQIELRRSVAQRRAEEARREADTQRAAREEATAKATAMMDAVKQVQAETEAAAAVEAAKKADAEKAKRWAELLTKFPPGEWTPDTPKQIEQRKLTLHVFPSDREQEFLEAFDEWRGAYEGWKLAQDAKATAKAK